MKRRNKLTNDEIVKLCNNITNYKITCKCGHRVFLGTCDKIICSWCGRYIFKDSKTEFEYRIKEKILKNTLKS